MSPWEAAAAAAREAFLEDLANVGFNVRSSERAEGDVEHHGRLVPVDIHIPPGFPYQPPKVRPIDGTGGLSWHAELDGTLCLWAAEECGSLPWQTARQVVERVQHWLDHDARGWIDDTPDLDLERYWPSTEGLVLHPDLDPLIGKVARLTRIGSVWTVKPGAPPEGGKQLGCLILDVGELAAPLRAEEQVLDEVAAIRPALEKRVGSRDMPLVMIRYWRDGSAGVLTLRATSTKPLTLASIATAHHGDATLQLRAGVDRGLLSVKAVAVIGLGAIGSQVAGLLARAGVGTLTLVDHDIVRPGNLIRHTATPADVGHPKPDVVQRQIRTGPSTTNVNIQREAVVTLEAATELLNKHDLVIDATANQAATRLLLDGARLLDRPVVSVCLVREGQVARVDRAPLRPGEDHRPAAPETAVATLMFEGGCGNPISPAPMWAATAAAARAVGACVDALTGRNEYPPTVLDVLVAGDGSCGPVGESG
ncbi:ThiF family adenylyltransferase [Euzebya tangerina]|uniref:ThiF family adenylyltransferase n=1 Tax=Euzebya tangerina TaxID=591198 RepID=UPI0013C2E031|nr:ThiF family adenylyltransferase [Euzebya tangerina]